MDMDNGMWMPTAGPIAARPAVRTALFGAQAQAADATPKTRASAADAAATDAGPPDPPSARVRLALFRTQSAAPCVVSYRRSSSVIYRPYHPRWLVVVVLMWLRVPIGCITRAGPATSTLPGHPGQPHRSAGRPTREAALCATETERDPNGPRWLGVAGPTPHAEPYSRPEPRGIPGTDMLRRLPSGHVRLSKPLSRRLPSR